MKTKFIHILFLVPILCYSQNNSELIKLENYYKVESVIFKANYSPPFKISNLKESFTPSKEQIIEVEEILVKQYDKITQQKTKSVKKKFCKYKRQYIGYITNDNNMIIAVNLLNFSNKRKAKRYFSNWKKEYIIGFDGFYYKNVEYFSANLNKKELLLGN